MDDLDIQRARRQDIEELVTVYRSAYRETRELGFPTKAANATAADLEAWLDDDWITSATLQGQLVGAVRITETSPERIKISRLGVHEDWQGKGIGSTLLDHVEATASQTGYESAWLTTPEGHPYLADFYRDRGYIRTRDYPLPYRDYDEIVMEKALRKD